MQNGYAILDEIGGWLVNTIVWDGDTSKWHLPTGMRAVPLGEIDFSTLPERPDQPMSEEN